MHVFGVVYTAEVYGKLKCSTTFNATRRSRESSEARGTRAGLLLSGGSRYTVADKTIDVTNYWYWGG
jgi:hypothetical protein